VLRALGTIYSMLRYTACCAERRKQTDHVPPSAVRLEVVEVGAAHRRELLQAGRPTARSRSRSPKPVFVCSQRRPSATCVFQSYTRVHLRARRRQWILRLRRCPLASDARARALVCVNESMCTRARVRACVRAHALARMLVRACTFVRVRVRARAHTRAEAGRAYAAHRQRIGGAPA
jgi:hypothetical protein